MTTITDRDFKIISLEHSWPMVGRVMSTDDACYAVGIDPPHYPVPAIDSPHYRDYDRGDITPLGFLTYAALLLR